MKIFYKKYKDAFFVLICLFILVLVITVVLMVLDIVNITSIIKINSNNDWLGYIGAIMGGFFTLFGVLLTIFNDNDRRKEDQSLLYKPIIQPSFDDIKHSEGFEIEFDIIQREYASERDIFPIEIMLKNKGRGETKNFKIETVEIIESSLKLDLSIMETNSKKIKDSMNIIPEGKAMLEYFFPKTLMINDKRSYSGFVIIKTTISFNDFIEYYEYKETYIMKVLIKDRSKDNYTIKSNKGYLHDVYYEMDENFKIKVESSFRIN